MKKHRLLLPALAFVLTTANAQISEPGDLIRTEGEKQVFIPCPYGGSSTPFWRINDTYYYHTRLPCPFIASTSPAGLVITVVDLSISGTTFQCLASVNGVIRESSTGEITVQPNPMYMPNDEDVDLALEIKLLYQRLRFTLQQLNLSWSIFDKDTIIDDIEESSTTSTVFASTCDLNNASVVVNTTDTTTLFPIDGYEEAFFHVTAFNENGTQIATMDTPFKIQSGVVTKAIPDVFVGRTCSSCITVPQPENGPFFNIPRSASSNNNDTFCKAVRAPSETGRCLDFASSCDDLADSPFSSLISVCSTTSTSMDYKMCFRNVTKGMNGTRIHFFYSETRPCAITDASVTSRLYIDSYEMITQDTSVSVDVSTNITTGELCVTSLPDGCYTTTVYNTTIYDVTGYYVNTTSGIEDGVCTQLDVLNDPSPECLPYLVEVDASNPLVTYSETITHRVGEAQATSSSYCKCAKARLKAPIVLNKNANNEIQFSCNTEADLRIGFVIIAVDGDNQSTSLSGELLTCGSTPNTVELSNLVSCNVQFTVSARFAFPNGSLTTCTLSDSAITVYNECPTTDAPTDGPTVSPLVALVVLVPILAMFALINIVIAVCIWCKHNTGHYWPQCAECCNNQPQMDRNLQVDVP